MKTLAVLAEELGRGATSSRRLVEECLERITDPSGEGSRTFLKVHADTARAAADYHDRLRQHGAHPSPWAGIPISVKDLFDIAGDVTTAGSKVLAGAAPARADALAVTRLKAAGLIPVGRTNMTEFAYSGLGLNPHHGTPVNPFDRQTGRIPGGSSSGAAVSITDGMAFGALGTDTGGSCRIPAALCGVAGFKPTARRVPLAGTFPLSSSLDSIGSLAPSVSCCATLDALIAGDPPGAPAPLPLHEMRLAVPRTVALDGLDAHVARAFERALGALSGEKAQITEIPLRELGELARINRKGGFPAAEAYALHRSRLATQADALDPRVAARIQRGAEQTAADYIDLLQARADLIERITPVLAPFDAVLMPTTPIIAPRLTELEEETEYGRINLLVLRNPAIVNFLDRCAISVPCHEAGSAPVGMMLMGASGGDRRLLALAATVEAVLSSRPAGR
jgi:aspartyl-tRNA(Asn)/glutamyl-tRNA(Gln) amidotransferase subunit A